MSDAGTTLIVQVVGEKGAPISGASVVLALGDNGPPSLAKTDRAGRARFEGLTSGFYSVHVLARGYVHTSDTVEINARYSEMTLAFRLSPYKTIASIPVHASLVSHVLSRTKGLGRLSVSLADMLNRFGDARVAVSADGSLVGVSLQGKDPSLTSQNFNGIALQNAADLQALAPDLLSAAQTNDQKNEVLLQTISSAPIPVYDFSGTVNGFAGVENKAQVQDTSGQVGFAAVLDQHHQDSALNGATYLDTSGLTYTHYGGYSSVSGLVHISLPVGDDWTGSFDVMRRRATEIPIPTYLTGSEPTGFGLGNVELIGTTAESVKLSGAAGDWMLYGGLSRFSRSDYQDYSHRYVGGFPLPEMTTIASDTNAMSLSAMRALGGGTLNLNGSLSFNRQSLADVQQTFTLPPSSVQLTRSSQFTAEYSSHLGPNASVDDDLQLAQRAGNASQSSLRDDVTVNYRRTRDLNIFASAGGGSRIGLAPDLQQFVSPASAQYDCAARSVVAMAPNPPPSTPRDYSVRGGFSLEALASSMSVQIYWENYDGVTLSGALVPAASESAANIPPNYLDELQQGYTLYGRCAPIQRAPIIYFEHNVPGLSVRYGGAELMYGEHLGRNVSLQASLDYHRATLTSADALLKAPDSVYIVGRQLPNVPLVRAGLTLDDIIPSHNEIIVNVAWTSGNNEHNLPSYCLWTAGFVRALSSVTSVSLVATNIAHSYVGLFNTPKFAVPLTSYDGIVGTVATPLVEPQLYVNLNVHVERDPPQR